MVERGVLVVSGHLFGGGVAVVVAVVGDKAFFAGVLEASDFAEEF